MLYAMTVTLLVTSASVVKAHLPQSSANAARVLQEPAMMTMPSTTKVVSVTEDRPAVAGQMFHPVSSPASEVHALSKASSNASIFCFIMMAPKEAPTVVRMLDRGLFQQGCNAFRLYSNTSFLANVTDHPNCAPHNCWEQAIQGSMEAPRGGVYNTTLNAGFFIATFNHIFKTGIYRKYDWTVKLDADAVWLPERLRGLVSLYSSDVPALGGNTHPECRTTYGPIEILTRPAMEAYASNVDVCQSTSESLDYISQYGEDLVLQRCLGLNDVRSYPMPLMLAWSVPGKCVGCEVAFHPFKSAKAWDACFEQLTAQAEQLGPIEQCAPRIMDDTMESYIRTVSSEMNSERDPFFLVDEMRCNSMLRNESQAVWPVSR